MGDSIVLYVFAFLGTFILTVIAERMLIPLLKRTAKQPIYEGGPGWHISKSGTPTMGGLAFLLGITFTLVPTSIFLTVAGLRAEAISLITCLIYAVLNSAIGIIDDSKKLRKRENAGLTPWQKLIFQSILAASFLYFRYAVLNESTTLSFSFGDLELGYLYYPIAFLTLVGMTNFANLADGIDGLASGIAFAVAVSLFYISYMLSYEAAFMSAAIIGATTGFLIFNLHPAKVFMGDTGSLLLGSIVASCGIALKNPLVVLCVGGVYVIEGISVVLQVLWFKLTGKRLFKMAPLHHHMEKLGWSENRICIVGIILTFISSIPAFIFYLP